jgi:thiosulfate dehydrogenase (quinone) large subunit
MSSRTSQQLPAAKPSRPSAPGHLLRDPRLAEVGWVLLPLRIFLGVTFSYAGISKLLDPHYLDPGSALGVRSQMLHAAVGSPIGGLVRFSALHFTSTGLLIAFAELAVGAATLAGLWTRLTATGGMLLAGSFALTVSWSTTPYYLGPDIAYLFAWTPLLIGGDGGRFSMMTGIRQQAAERLNLNGPRPRRLTPELAAELDRQVLRRTALAAGTAGVVAVLLGVPLALARRLPRSQQVTLPVSPGPAATGPAATGPAATGATATGAAADRSVIAAVSAVPVGQTQPFTLSNGGTGLLLHRSDGSFVAFDSACTHQGCPVQWSGQEFQCPCHGATYDASGQVTGGPAPSPLAPVAVTVRGSDVVLG